MKNQDNREHDIFDSDDYLQDHGGMVASDPGPASRRPRPRLVRRLGRSPPAPRVRSLAEEAARVVRSRVVNPKWISAMPGHGYKGAIRAGRHCRLPLRLRRHRRGGRGLDVRAGDRGLRRRTPPCGRSSSGPTPGRCERSPSVSSRRRPWPCGASSETALATLRRAVLEAEGWEEGQLSGGCSPCPPWSAPTTSRLPCVLRAVDPASGACCCEARRGAPSRPRLEGSPGCCPAPPPSSSSPSGRPKTASSAPSNLSGTRGRQLPDFQPRLLAARTAACSTSTR